MKWSRTLLLFSLFFFGCSEEASAPCAGALENVGDSCPEHCCAMNGDRYDQARGCLTEYGEKRCEEQTSSGECGAVAASVECYVRRSDGEVFQTSSPFYGDYQEDWEPCDTPLRNLVLNAEPCEPEED